VNAVQDVARSDAGHEVFHLGAKQVADEERLAQERMAAIEVDLGQARKERDEVARLVAILSAGSLPTKLELEGGDIRVIGKPFDVAKLRRMLRLG